jgi:hypothetical protein
MPRAMPLLPPSLLTPCAARLASSSLATRRVALSHATPCPAHYPDADVCTKHLRRRLHANPVPLSACVHAFTLTLSEHNRALASTSSGPIGPGAHNY